MASVVATVVATVALLSRPRSLMVATAVVVVATVVLVVADAILGSGTSSKAGGREADMGTDLKTSKKKQCTRGRLASLGRGTEEADMARSLKTKGKQ